jgi:hypothetical protein
VIAGVLGRAGETGRKHRLALAAEKKYNFTPTDGLQTPGHLKNTKARYPYVIKLGGTIQELEEQDRGIVYDYRLEDDGQSEHIEGKQEGQDDSNEMERYSGDVEGEDKVAKAIEGKRGGDASHQLEKSEKDGQVAVNDIEVEKKDT